MKFPGCNYIVVFPKPLPSFIDQSMKQKDGSMMSIWLPGKNDGHILELNNMQFSSDFKKNHHYKVMQAHIAWCDGCHFQPDCFRKPRLPPTDCKD